jgi:hypothetical protein
VDWLLGLRRERADAKAGARLVAADIASAESEIEAAERTGQWWGFFGHPITSWPDYRDVLAMKLSNEDFDSVSQAVIVLEGIRQKLPTTPRGSEEIARQGYLKITDPAKSLNPIRREAAKAYNALVKLAGHDRVGQVIER